MTLNVKKLRVGTRGSKLALTQTDMFCRAVGAAFPDIEIEVVVIKASGDWKPAQGEVRLSEQAGGKGQFVKEIEEAIDCSHVDVGVHSLKDVPTFMPDGLVINHFLPRGEARDAFISGKAASIETLPAGSVIGTSSVRRQAAILNRRPDLKVATLRGNVDTRLEKLRAGQVDAIILAAIGLERLGLKDVITGYITPENMLPAVGQGVIGIESRSGDSGIHAVLEAINHSETRLQVVAERALVERLNGSCGTPIGAYATRMQDGRMRLRGFLATTDGQSVYEAEDTADVHTVEDARALGLKVGNQLCAQVPEAVMLALAC